MEAVKGTHRPRLNRAAERIIREELRRTLDSAAFRNSKRCSEFLEYVVEHSVLGHNGNTLKERSIGIALFQLPPEYDTSERAVVRVTATEVRKKLAQYYNEAGSDYLVRIELPAGSYSPEFHWKQCEPDLEAGFEKPRAKVIKLSFVLTGLVVLVVAAAAFILNGRTSPKPAPPKASSVPARPGAARADGSEDIRFLAGSLNSYVDRNGQMWLPDRFFSGGTTIARPEERILRTLDPDIYRSYRQGNFRYDIPLKPGLYELRLHFAETNLSEISQESSGETDRVFHVLLNGERLLSGFDIVSDAAGSNIANERVFRNVQPAEDGFLHLSFSPVRRRAILSGLEVWPMVEGKCRPTRIAAGRSAYYHDPKGHFWQADRYFLGGNAIVRGTSPIKESLPGDSGSGLYTSERWGHFSYSIPVADGNYTVTLRFCEAHYGPGNPGGGGLGSRLFDVHCNGVMLLKDFDIFKAAGGAGRPVEKTFAGFRPNAQGKLILTFVPGKDAASLNGIEIVDEARPKRDSLRRRR